MSTVTRSNRISAADTPEAFPIPNPNRRSGLGDLTVQEVESIQGTTNRAGRPLGVAGSAAKGTRQPWSDVDYLATPGSLPYLQPHAAGLPRLEPTDGSVPGSINPFQGPGIQFSPKSRPVLVPSQK